MTKLNLALTALKAEIRRLAGSEVKAQIAPLKKTISALRSEVVALKKEAKATRRATRHAPAANGLDEGVGEVAFSAKRFKANRKRLKLSAADCGLMLETTGTTVYNWENKGMLPRSAVTLDRIRALMRIKTPAEARSIVDQIRSARSAA